jgi:solute carrier family 15 oligopeptide transporter 1
MSLGTGGIKSCVAAFGGEQFQLPEQAAKLASFFSMFYFAITCGGLASTMITPVIRTDVHCFGMTDCYPLAFGLPAVLIVISIVIFLAGKRSYRILEPQGNMFLNVCYCIGVGFIILPKTNILDGFCITNFYTPSHFLECLKSSISIGE